MEIIQSPSPNFSSRHGRKPIAIVNHITSGPYPGCRDWLSNPEAQASAHHIVTMAGLIVQLVQDENAAWHAGIVNHPSWSLYDGTNPNWYTIGIEHENLGGGQLTELQYQSTLWLHKMLIQKWGIPVSHDTIIGHYRIDSVNRPNCPGPLFPWTRLFSDLSHQSVNIMVNGQVLQGIIVNDRSYAPVRVIMGLFNLPYGWDPQSESVVINGMLVKVVIQNDTGYAKVNELAAAIGRQVSWDAGTNTATIL